MFKFPLRIIAIAACLVGSMQAQLITKVGVQYVTAISPKIGLNNAGVDPITGWNYVQSLGSITDLKNTAGASTGINLSTSAIFGIYNQSYDFLGGSAGDEALFSTGALTAFNPTNTVSFTLSGLTAGNIYGLTIYTMSNVTGTLTQGSLTGGPTYYLLSPASITNTVYTQGTATTAGAAAVGNYFQYTGITGVTSLTFTLFNGAGDFADLPGFQFSQTTVVPEPSTGLLMVMGAGLLMVRYRRRKCSAAN